MFTGIVLAALLSAQAAQPAAPDDAPKLVLYTQTLLAGDSRSILAAFANLEAIDFDNKARSVRVIAGAWEVCEEKHFKKCRVVDANVPDLETIGLSRRISSVRLAGPSGAPATRPAVVPSGGPAPRIVFFDKDRFRGESLALDEARGNLAALTARVESLRVLAGVWQLCTGMNYTGNCMTIDSDRAELGPWRNAIVSARPVASGAPPR